MVHNVFKGETENTTWNCDATERCRSPSNPFPSHDKLDRIRCQDLQNDDRVAIGFTVVGQSVNALNFYVTDPHGKTVIEYEKVGQKSFSLHATTAGVYILHFDNSSWEEEKMVTLNYDVQHYILGLPQTLFYVLVIGVISVIGIFFFVLLGKASY